MSPHPRPRIVTGVIVATFGLAAATGLAARTPALLVINETASVPRGLYVRSGDPEPRLDRLVTIAQPAGARHSRDDRTPWPALSVRKHSTTACT